MRRPCAVFASMLVLGLLAAPSSVMALEPSPHEMNPALSPFPEGKLQKTEANYFEDACGLAVPPPGTEAGANGFLYVSDYHHDDINVFYDFGRYGEPAGGEIKIPNIDPGNGPCGLVVNDKGVVYVNTWREDVLMLTPSEQANVETPSSNTKYARVTIDSAGTDTGVALDPSTEDVYVDNGTYISEYTAAGSLIQTFGFDESAEYFGIGVSTYPSTNGYVYVADAHTDTVKVFNPAVDTAAPVEQIDGAGTPQRGFDYLGESTVTVDDSAESPSFGHVYVVDNLQHNLTEHPEVALDEFNPRGAYRGQIYHWIVKEGNPPRPVEHRLTASEPNGVALNKVGNVFVTSGNDEGSVEANENDIGSLAYAFEPMALAKPLKVSKAGSGAGIIESSPAGIYCGTACEAEYTKEAGEIVTLTAKPDAHSAFVGWNGGCSGNETVCHITIGKTPVEVTAEFEALPQQPLVVTVGGSGEGDVTTEPAGIECSSGSTCTEGFNEGSTVSLVATPSPHNRFVEWLGPDCDESTQPTCQISMTQSKAIEARFAPIPQKTLSVSVEGGGTVISEPSGISCPSNCAVEFDEERVVTLVAAPAIHQELAGWRGCTEEPTSHECVVSMGGQDRTVKAEFTPIRRHLSIAIVGSGSVSADHGGIAGCTGSGGSCSALYLDGEIVRLTATAAPGYIFAGWSGGLCGGTGICELGLEADASVTANFATPPVQLTLSAPKVNIHLRKAQISGTAAALTVHVTGAGTILASGKQLSRAHASTKEAGTVVLHVRLTKSGRAALERSRRHKLSTPVSIAFVPAGESNRVLIQHVLTFRAPNRHHGGGRHGSKGRRHGKHRG